MQVLVGLFFVLLVVTLVGHGIWVTIAAVLRSLLSSEDDPSRRMQSGQRDEGACAACEARLRTQDVRCPQCGLSRGQARQVRDLEAASRQVRALAEREELDEEIASQVIGLLYARRRVVLGQPAAPPAPAAAPERVRVPPLPLSTRAVEINEEILDVLPAEPEKAASPELPALTGPGSPLPALTGPGSPEDRSRSDRTTEPRRPLTSVLSAFMEERNILWGELVGGLLIVGCSIALVLTLWRNLQALPYFPFLIFTVLTAALFGAGQYTFHHWKLQSTSRGLLLIALLLVPLNLLILADPAARGSGPPIPIVEVGIRLVALLLFTALVWVAGRDLIGIDLLPGPIDRRWLLALAVVGTAGCQMFNPLLSDAHGWFIPLAALSTACQLLACLAVFGGLAIYGPRESRLGQPQAIALFSFLGLGTFALAASFAFLLTGVKNVGDGLIDLAVPLVLAGVPGVAFGLLVTRRLDETVPPAMRVTGTAVAVAGLGVMFLAIALAWPVPGPLLTALTLTGVVLTLAAVFTRAAWLHAGAIPALLVALLLAFHLVVGHLPRSAAVNQNAALVRLLTSTDSACVLVVAAAFMGVLAGWLRRRGHDVHALPLDVASVTAGLVALIVVNAHGPQAPLTAAAVHAGGVIVALLASRRWRGDVLPHAAGAVLIAGVLWAMQGWYPGRLEWWGLTMAGLSLALAIVDLVCARKEAVTLARASRRTALFAGSLGLFMAVVSGSFATNGIHTATTFTLTLALLVEAVVRRDDRLFAAFQVALTVAVLCGVTAFASGRGWLADVRVVQAYGVGLGLLSLGWVLARRLSAGREGWQELWLRSTPNVEQVTMCLVLVGQFLLAGFGAWLSVDGEWGSGVTAHVANRIAGPGGWLVLIAAVPAWLGLLLARAREEETSQRQSAIVALTLLGIIPALLYATLHSIDLAGASALRWGLAVTFLVGSALVWLREPLDRLAGQLGLVSAPAQDRVRALLAVVACLVVTLTAILTGLGFSGAVLPGPLPASVFARMGSVVSSIGPLALVIVGLIGTSWRERSSGYALSAGLLAGISAMGGCALGVVQAGGVIGADRLVFIGFLGSTVFAAGGLAWMTARKRIGEGELLAVQTWLGLAVVLVVAATLLPDLLRESGTLFLQPLIPDTLALGSLALLLSAAVALWHATVYSPQTRINVAGISVFVVGILAACVVRPYDTPGWWLSYHVLTGFWSLTALAVVAGGSLLPGSAERWTELFPERRMRRWATGLAVLLTILSLLRGYGTFPERWMAHGAALSAAVLCGAVALWYGRGGFAHASGLLFTLAVFQSRLTWLPAGGAVGGLSVSLGLALSATFWLVIELPQLRENRTLLRWGGVSYAPLATFSALLLLVLTVASALLGDASGQWFVSIGPAGWLAAGAVGLALGVAVWARQTNVALPELYVLGLTVAGLVLHALRPTPEQLRWMTPLALGCNIGLVSLAGVIWRQLVSGIPSSSGSFQLPHPVIPDRHWDWLLPTQVLLAAIGILLAVIASVSDHTLIERLMGPATLGLLALAAVGMARVAPASWPGRLHLVALALIPATAGLLAWAVPDPSGAAPWLERNAWLLFTLTLSAIVGLEALASWSEARRLSLIVGGLAVVVLLVLMAQMFPHYDKDLRRTVLTTPAIACVLLAMLGLLASALRLALRRGHDPLGLSESWRTSYVYLAEVLLVLLFVHIRLNIPELFLGALARYWVFAVLLAAFVGVGLGEWCERRGLRVLAVPLGRTGVFLPLLPILAFWAKPPMALLEFADRHAPGLLPLLGYFQKLPRHFDSHALVWFMTSALYMLLALARRSTFWALVGALTANLGFWALLTYAGVGFFVHPQAWVIPLALIVLVAEYLHRDELGPQTSETLRYLGISLIYVASTADLFLHGLGNSLWLPIILALLCVAGVAAGILFRVRAFLFLGVGFLLVDLLSMIWHAAVDRAHTWLWWVSGIILGTAILAVFAMFEKRRDAVLKVVEDLKHWD